jgi:hypothetical protein
LGAIVRFAGEYFGFSTTVPDGDLVADARNPLARLQLPLAEDRFRAMNELLAPEIWLH